MKTYLPLGSMVLLKVEEPKEEKTKAGIVLPGSNDSPYAEATVIDAGYDVKLGVEPGQKVLYFKHASPIPLEDGRILINMSALIAVITD